MGNANASFRGDGEAVDYLKASFGDSNKRDAIRDKISAHPELKSRVAEILGDIDQADVLGSVDPMAVLTEHASDDQIGQLAKLLQANETQ